MLTLRAFYDEDLNKMQEMIYEDLTFISSSEKISYSIKKQEEFPALINNEHLFKKFYNIALKSDYKIEILDEDFRWSEDFAYFSQSYPAFYFGIGAGNIANLHSVEYDFPDDLIAYSAEFLENIVENIF